MAALWIEADVNHVGLLLAARARIPADALLVAAAAKPWRARATIKRGRSEEK
jgi:hypothetical protein